MAKIYQNSLGHDKINLDVTRYSHEAIQSNVQCKKGFLCQTENKIETNFDHFKVAFF